MQHILLIDDDCHLLACMRGFLTAAGYEVSAAEQASAARAQFAAGKFALAVVDLMLPDGEGLDLVREMRAQSPLPLIVISARGDGADRMLALEAGADMYLAKPFELEELVGRVAACLRTGGEDSGLEPLTCGELRVDGVAHRAWAGEQELTLTPKEFELLTALLKAGGEVCRSADLLWEVWGYPPEVRTRTLDVHVGRLRKQLAKAPSTGCRLLTVSGIGYRLVEDL